MIYDIDVKKNDRTLRIYSTSSPVQQTALIDPVLHLEVDTSGTFEFGVPHTNYVLSKNYGTKLGIIERMVTEFFIYRTLTKDDQRTRKVIWRGRALTVDYDFYNTPVVHCEGALSYFNDTIQDKAAFEYIEAEGISVKGDTTTPLTDMATTNPIVINGNNYTAVSQDAVFYNYKEFIFDGVYWHEYKESKPTLETILRHVIAVHNMKCPSRQFQYPQPSEPLTKGFKDDVLKDNPFYITPKSSFEVLTELKNKYGGHFRVVYDEIPADTTEPEQLRKATVPRLEWYATYNENTDSVALKGETTTPLTDMAMTNPIVINGTSYTASDKDAVFYGSKEFVFDGTFWHKYSGVAQTISFADNLVDITRQLNGENIINAVYPIGKAVNKGGSIVPKRDIPITSYNGIYQLLTSDSAPEDWNTTFYNYYTYERNVYIKVPRSYQHPDYAPNKYYKFTPYFYYVHDPMNAVDYMFNALRWEHDNGKKFLYSSYFRYVLNKEYTDQGYNYRGAYPLEDLPSGENVSDKDTFYITNNVYPTQAEIHYWDASTETYQRLAPDKSIYEIGKFVQNETKDWENNKVWDEHAYFVRDIYRGTDGIGHMGSAINTRIISTHPDDESSQNKTRLPHYWFSESIQDQGGGSGPRTWSSYYITTGFWDSDDSIAAGFIHDFPSSAFKVSSGETYYIHSRVGASTIGWAITQHYMGRYQNDASDIGYDYDTPYYRSISAQSARSSTGSIVDFGFKKIEVPFPQTTLVDPGNGNVLPDILLNVCGMTYMRPGDFGAEIHIPWDMDKMGVNILETRKVPEGLDEHITLLGLDDGTYEGYITTFTDVTALAAAWPAIPDSFESSSSSVSIDWYVKPKRVEDGWFIYTDDPSVIARTHYYPTRADFPEPGSAGNYYVDESNGDLYVYDNSYTLTDQFKVYRKENFYVVDKKMEQKYGRIEKLLTFDDVEDPETLKKLASYYLYYGQFESLEVTITALDLALFGDRDVETPDILDGVRAVSAAHDLDLVLPVKSRDIPFNKLEDMTWELGYEATRKITSKGW